MDLWIRQWRGRTAQVEMIAVRYADDSVPGFEKREDAWSFRHALEARLAQFNLTLHPEKTRLPGLAGSRPKTARSVAKGNRKLSISSGSRISVVKPRTGCLWWGA